MQMKPWITEFDALGKSLGKINFLHDFLPIPPKTLAFMK